MLDAIETPRIHLSAAALCAALFAAPFALSATGCARMDAQQGADDDGDGLGDPQEADGWTVTVYGPTGPEQRRVRPRADMADTDGDGLDDAEEFRRRLDPTRADTDGDGLDDRAEIELYGSRADHIDSDGDASGPDGTADPRFWDRGEVEEIGTSPALADTDGDGFDDRFEYVELGTNPLIADLPQLELSVQAFPEIGLNTTLSTGESEVFAVSESITRSISMTHSESRTTSESFSLMVGFGLSAGWSGGLHIVANFNTEMTTTREVSLTIDRSYTEAASAQVGETRQRARSRELTFESGYVAFPVQVANRGPIAFTLRNASMTLLHRDPKRPMTRRALAHVGSVHGFNSFPSQSLAPGQAFDNVYYRNEGLGWDDAIALMQDPRGLEVEISGYELVDADGRPFAHDATLRQGRTASLVIDYGPTRATGPHSLERVLATNLRLDPATGEPAGLLLMEALEQWLGHEVELRQVPGADGQPVSVIASVDGHAAAGSVHEPAARSRWIVVRGRGEQGEVVLGDVETLRLMPGEAVHLVYDEDQDGDGLGVRTERRLGTSDAAVDTDGDGLSDGEEALNGWLPGEEPVEAFSDPTLPDTDLDGLADRAERDAGTDAFNPDTDGDGLSDGIDRAPLDVDVFTFEDVDVRPIDDGAAIELSWAPVSNPAIERIYILREPIDALGQLAALPEDTLEMTAEALALELGADVVGALSPAETRFVDQPTAEADTWRYLAYVAYADVGLLPAAGWVLDHEQVLRHDRVRVELIRLEHVGDDECDVSWEWSAAPGDGISELGRRAFRLSPQDAFEVDEDTVVHIAERQLSPDERRVDLILPRDGTGFMLIAQMWQKARRGQQSRLGVFEVPHTLDEAESGGEWSLEFDDVDDPGECTIRAVYTLAVVERGLVDPGLSGVY